MSIGVTAAVTVPRALPVTPPVACVARIGVSCRIGCATVKSNWSVSTDQPAASSVSITYSTLASYPGVAAARVPPFASAIAWNAA